MDDWALRPAFLALLAFMGALIAARSHGWLRPKTDGPLAALAGRPSVTVEARAVSPLKLELQGSKFIARTGAGEGVEVFFPRSWPAERIPLTGQDAVFAGRLRRPRPARNPGEFDERAFLADRDVGWVLQAREASLALETPSWRWTAAARAERLRRLIESRFAALLPEPSLARLLDGIVLGDKGPLPRELNAAVQDAGVMHLLVPSGAKVGLVFLGAAILGWLLALGPWPRWALAAGLAGVYVAMVGGEPPYLRAFWCALALGAGLASGRECAPFDALVLSAWLVLLAAPRDLFSLGFQMTYAAAFGLCVLLPGLRALVPGSWPRTARWAAEAAAASAVVQFILAPLLAQAFGRVSLVAVASNLALVPLASLIAPAGLSLLAFPRAAPAVAALLELFAAGCRFFARWPACAVAAAPWPAGDVVAYYLLPAAWLAWPRRAAAAALLAAALLAVSAPRAWARLAAPSAQVLYLALPRGQAALLSIGGRDRWLIEGGAPAGPILKALRAEGRPTLARIVADESPGSDRALPKLRAYAPAAAVEREKAFRWRQKNIVFEFWPPRLRRGPDEFSIIAAHRRAALTAATDGSTIQIR